MKQIVYNAISQLNASFDFNITIGNVLKLHQIEQRKRRINEWFSKRYGVDADITTIRINNLSQDDTCSVLTLPIGKENKSFY